jgi:anti-sigma factor RsiW
MTELEHPISEEDLHCMVDGRLAENRRVAVERHLRLHPEDARRVAAYTAQRETLLAAFAVGVERPLPSSLNLAHLVEYRMRARRRISWQIAASILLALSAGSAVGWILRANLFPPAASGIHELAQDATASYLVYAADRRHPAELGPAQSRDLAHWLSVRLNRPVAPPNLSIIGYDFLGGRLVATRRGAAALFLYQDALGERLSVFVRAMTSLRDMPMLKVPMDNINGCAWVQKGVGYSVIAEEPYDELLGLAQVVRRQVEAGEIVR